MKQDEINIIISEHGMWLCGNTKGKRANLSGASLRGANLCYADLSGANLRGANLCYADLSGANLCYANLSDANLRSAYLSCANLSGASLRGANLCYANLSGANLSDANLRSAYLSCANLRSADLRSANLSDANLSGANLSGADLSGANLSGANLSGADLSGANLSGANLRGANLRGANLPDFSIVPDTGSFIGWKKTSNGSIVELLIPKDAKRVSSLVGRKCRASYVHVQAIHGKKDGAISIHDCTTTYIVGEKVYPDSFDPDIRAECTHGIHFFITRKEAEEYVL